MRTDHLKRPRDAAVEAARAAAFERKQRWKEQPGNRYTPEELRRMAEDFGEFTMIKPKTKVMYIE